MKWYFLKKLYRSNDYCSNILDKNVNECTMTTKRTLNIKDSEFMGVINSNT